MIQRLMPALQGGQATFAVLTGLGGLGKSILAKRVVNRLEASGFTGVFVKSVIASTPDESGQAICYKIVSTLAEAFSSVSCEDLHDRLLDANIPLPERLALAIRGLNKVRLVLILDDFDEVLDLKTRRISNPDLAHFYKDLILNLIEGSRVVVTCRYDPTDTPTSVEHLPVLKMPLTDFSEGEFLKFLRHDPEVESRIRPDDLDSALLTRLYAAFGGIPRLLGELRTLLRSAVPKLLLDELEGGEPGELNRIREVYLNNSHLSQLMAALSNPARSLTCRLALSILPLPFDGVASITHHQDDSHALLNEAFAYGLVQRFDEANLPPLFCTPALLRSWLVSIFVISQNVAIGVHKQLATFWRSAIELDRTYEFRASIDFAVFACREHSRSGNEGALFQWSTNFLATRLENRGEWLAARALLEEIPDAERDIETVHNLASFELNIGNHDAARSGLTQVLLRRRELKDRSGEATTLHNLASIDLRTGKLESAQAGFDEALLIHRELKERYGIAATLDSLASIDMHRGHYHSAIDRLEESLLHRLEIDDFSGLAATLSKFASVYINYRRYETAYRQLEYSLKISRVTPFRSGMANARFTLASLYIGLREFESARHLLDQVLGYRLEVGDRSGVAATLHNIAVIEVNLENYPKARELLNQALLIYRDHEINDILGEAGVICQLGAIAFFLNKNRPAILLIAAAFQLMKGIESIDSAEMWDNLLDSVSQLDYNLGQLNLVLREAGECYRLDRCNSTIQRAFCEI